MINVKKKLFSIGKSFKKNPISSTVFTLTGILMFIFGVSLLVPIFWTLSSSLKDSYYYQLYPFRLPDVWMFSNYKLAWDALRVEVWNGKEILVYTYGNMFFYSFIITTVLSLLGMILPVCIAYATARYKFKGRNILYMCSIVVMTVPIVGSLASQLTIRKALGLYDNLIPFLLTSGSGFGFNTILFHGILTRLSNTYAEAARMDGAGHWRIMLQIYIPMIMPTAVALFIMAFVGNWNNYMLNVTYLPSYPNLAYGVYLFNEFALVNQHPMPVVMAAFVLVSIPTIILWCATQRFIVGKVMIGGLKG